MIQNKKRKEVVLDTETISLLKFQAEREGRNLKNFMEYILREKANNIALTDTYKYEMDSLLEKHKKGNLSFISEENFRDKTKR